MEYLQKALELKAKGKSITDIMKELDIKEKYRTVQSQLRRAEIKNIDLEEYKEKLLKLLKTGATIDSISEDLKIYKEVARNFIQELEKTYNIIKENDTYILKTIITTDTNEYTEEWEGTETIKFGVVSDTHIGNKWAQNTFLDKAYDIFKERDINTVYHCGDISDGYYKHRDGQVYELHAIGFDEQADYIIKNYPRKRGIITKFITGNHDNTHIMNGGSNIGKKIERERKDMVWLGNSNARVWITPKCDIELNHPTDGVSYALSYSIQKYIDSMTGGQKPKILFNGHHHKFLYLFYRNIHALEVPSTQAQTPFMRGKRIPAHMGAVICTVRVAEDGTIKNFNCELIPLLEPKENDY